jgi:hypothetical protein
MAALGGASAASAQAPCVPCARLPQDAACAACPAEIRAVLAGATFVVRRAENLPDDCLRFETSHPMLTPEGRARWSKPLDEAEVRDAERFGVMEVRVAPACEDAAGRVPPRVIFSRPLSDAERTRDDGSAKPVVFVDGSDPHCLRPGRRDAAGPFCTVSAAVDATRDSGGAVVEIAPGRYEEPRPIQLGHGHVLVGRGDGDVTISGWLDLSAGAGPGRPWVEASRDERGSVWVTDWSDHGDMGGSGAVEIPFFVDGREVPMAPHWSPQSRASDVEEIAFTEHDARVAGPTFVWANPDHPAACLHSGVNVKSQELRCELDGRTLPCDECTRRGLGVGARADEGSCRAPPGACRPVTLWRTSKDDALDLCRRTLGPDVRRCVVLKLGPGDAPGRHRVRSSHTDHGLKLYNDADTVRSGVVVRGLRLDGVPVTFRGARRVTARSGLTARLDGLELLHSPVGLLGSHLVLENGRFLRGRVLVSGSGAPLVEVTLRNNRFERQYGKPIHWTDARAGWADRAPRRLHALEPLCERLPCARGPAPVLFGGREAFAGWRGWNRVLFNVFRSGSGLDAGPTSYLLMVANAFENGGLQEGVIELAQATRHVLVHHNWARDGLGSGIYAHGHVEDLVVTDNQLIRQPGRLEDGAGNDRSPAMCRLPNRSCAGTPYAILFKPSSATCRQATFANNLAVDPRHGGVGFHGCAELTIRNHTAFGGDRPFLLAASAHAYPGARVLDNVAFGGDDRRSVDYWDRGRRPFAVGRAAGNFFEGCASDGHGCPVVDGAPLVRSDPAWSGPPRFADPARGDYHLLDVPALGDCGPDDGPPRPHAGFLYRDELCGPDVP